MSSHVYSFILSIEVIANALVEKQSHMDELAGKLRRQKLSLPLFANATCPAVKLRN
jgi:hypothetical protein